MFSNLTDFGYERSAKQAIGFYLAYLFAAILLGALAGGGAAIVTGDSSFEMGTRVGTLAAVILSIVLGSLIANNKGLWSSFSTIPIIILSGILALFIGAIGGLVPVAYLSTRESAHNQSMQQSAD